MSAATARVLRYRERYIPGSAAPARDPYYEPRVEPDVVPLPRERAVPKATPRERIAEQKAIGISLFAIVGALVIAALLVFVMLAQVNFNEVSKEAASLNSHLEALNEQNRKLTIAFESVIDMKDVEQYAKDVLGMSKPEAEQYAVVRTTPDDRAEVFGASDDQNYLQEFGSYLSYLFDEYIR